MKHTRLICICLFLLAFLSGANSQDALTNFLQVTMDNYGDWLRSTGRDPTPTITRLHSYGKTVGNVNITTNVWNQVISNHAPHTISSEGSSLLDGQVRLSFNANFSIDAQFNVSGTILSSIPVSGGGALNAPRVDIYLLIIVYDWNVNAEGYIDLSDAKVSHTYYVYQHVDVILEDLSAGGYESDVRGHIWQDYFKDKSWLPLAEYAVEYLRERFAETPVSEMIGISTSAAPTEGVPSTWTPPTASSSTLEPPTDVTARPNATYPSSEGTTTLVPPSTTRPPGNCDGSRTIHGELVLDRSVIKLEDGRNVVATKKIVYMTVFEKV